MSNFSAQISERIAAYEKRLEATFKSSVQDTAELITQPMAKGGRMRVKTGFLRASLMASTASMPSINPNARPDENGAYDLNSGAIEAVILGAQMGDPIYLGFTAAYARPREYRDGFVEGAFLQWQAIVNRNAERAIQAYP